MSAGDAVGVCLPAAALYFYPDRENLPGSASEAAAQTHAGEP
jgi:hypothetical protein